MRLAISPSRNQPTDSAEEADVSSSDDGEARLSLSHRDAIFGFEFAAMHFAKPGKNRYAYRMEGFNDDWIETEANSRFAQYTNLDSGDYVFRVKAANADGVWNEEGVSMPITVQPPPWKTWWAYSLYALALAMVVLGYVHSHRKELRRERAVSRRLREVDKLKDEFLANTSHELRTPLHGITGLAESLIGGARGELPGPVRADLSMLVASGRRLGRLVGDILDFSKLRHKSLELNRRPVDLRSLAEVVLALSRPLVGNKDLELRNNVPADLPPAEADEDRLQQILYNLVGNAIKFTESGTIVVTAEARGGELVVGVTDTGIGIAEEKQERIFEAFEQADASVEREYGGTGLGLAVTAKLIELHGGKIGVESRPGEGSTFFFNLKLTEATEPATEPATDEPAIPLAVSPVVLDRPDEPQVEVLPADRGGEISDSSRVPNLLLVDDEPVNLQVLYNHLSLRNFNLALASSGSEALSQLEKQDFDLVLLDVMMPKMSGYEVCRIIRRTHPIERLPILFLSAMDRDEDRIAGLDHGANDYLSKPITKGELFSRVDTHLKLLEAHRLQEQEVVSLRGLLPICVRCKNIRDDNGYWNQIEVYVSQHSEAEFSHGVCPSCVEKLYPGLLDSEGLE